MKELFKPNLNSTETSPEKTAGTTLKLLYSKRQQSTEWEKIFTNYTQGLISRICKKLKKFKYQKANLPMTKGDNIVFKAETQMAFLKLCTILIHHKYHPFK